MQNFAKYTVVVRYEILFDILTLFAKNCNMYKISQSIARNTLSRNFFDNPIFWSTDNQISFYTKIWTF
jgi:hypothetical protein